MDNSALNYDAQYIFNWQYWLIILKNNITYPYPKDGYYHVQQRVLHLATNNIFR
jgi:hypothetical protein